VWESNPRHEHNNFIVILISLRLFDLETESVRTEPGAPNTVITLSTCYLHGFLIWKRSLWVSNPRPEQSNTLSTWFIHVFFIWNPGLWESNPRFEHNNYIANFLSLLLFDLVAESVRTEPGAANTVITLTTCYHYGFFLWKRSIWESNPRPEHNHYIVNLLSLGFLPLEADYVRIEPAPRTQSLHCQLAIFTASWFGSGVCEYRTRAPNRIITLSTCFIYGFFIWKPGLWELNPRHGHNNFIVNLLSLRLFDLEAECLRF
jgi:hypothetical protein